MVHVKIIKTEVDPSFSVASEYSRALDISEQQLFQNDLRGVSRTVDAQQRVTSAINSGQITTPGRYIVLYIYPDKSCGAFVVDVAAQTEPALYVKL